MLFGLEFLEKIFLLVCSSMKHPTAAFLIHHRAINNAWRELAKPDQSVSSHTLLRGTAQPLDVARSVLSDHKKPG